MRVLPIENSARGGFIPIIREETGDVTIFFYSHTNFGFSMRMMRYISVISDRFQ
jgi:hypothetical protein